MLLCIRLAGDWVARWIAMTQTKAAGIVVIMNGHQKDGLNQGQYVAHY